MIVSVKFVYDPSDVLRQTLPDIHLIEEFPFYMYQTLDIRCR
jgi:hypothetical protein